MESFSINLNQMEDKGARYKRLLISLALSFILTSFAAYFLFFKNNDNPNLWILGAWGVYLLLYFYFAFVGYNAKMFINADDFALEYQFGFFRKVPEKLIWETITKVKLGFTYIAFFKRTGKRKVIKIGWLPYSKVKEIKNIVNSICDEKGIEVVTAEYQK